MAPPPEYDKEPKAPDKSATNISCEETKALHNLVNDQQTNLDNKSASAATNAEVENNKHVETLDDGQLRALLDEAITYKCPKDREGKSSLFKELLEEVEQDEQACEAAARAAGGRGTRSAARGGRGRRALPHSNSLQDLVAALAADPAPRRARHHPAHPAPPPAPVSARAIHGGSLPSGVDTSFLLGEEPSTRSGGAGYLATVRCVNPPPLAERRVSASDANGGAEADPLNRRSKPAFPITYTARASLEIGSGSVCSGRAVTTTTASNQVRTRRVPQPTRGPPDRLCLNRLYRPRRRGAARRVPPRRRTYLPELYEFIEPPSDFSISNSRSQESADDLLRMPVDDDSTDEIASDKEENIDPKQLKLLSALIPKTQFDVDSNGGGNKANVGNWENITNKPDKSNVPRGPRPLKIPNAKHQFSNNNNKQNINESNKDAGESDVWLESVNNWYAGLSLLCKKDRPKYEEKKHYPQTYSEDKQYDVFETYDNTLDRKSPNYLLQNNSRSEYSCDWNHHSNSGITKRGDFLLPYFSNTYQRYPGTAPWLLNTNDYVPNHDPELERSREEYRKRVGDIVAPRYETLNPKNIRSMSIAKPLPEFDNSDVVDIPECVIDKIKLDNNETELSDASKDKHVVIHCNSNTDLQSDTASLVNDLKTKNNNLENVTDSSFKSSSPIDELCISIDSVVKSVENVNKQNNTLPLSPIRDEDCDKGIVNVPVFSQFDCVIVSDEEKFKLRDFSYSKDEDQLDGVELVDISSKRKRNAPTVDLGDENYVELQDMSHMEYKQLLNGDDQDLSYTTTSSALEDDSFSKYVTNQQNLIKKLENSYLDDNTHEHSLISFLGNSDKVQKDFKSDCVNEELEVVDYSNVLKGVEEIECMEGSSGSEPKSNEVVIQVDKVAIEKASGDKYILTELPNNAFVYLTVPQGLLLNINKKGNFSLQIEHSKETVSSHKETSNSKKKKKDVAVEKTKNKEASNKKALKTLLFRNLFKSASADKSISKGLSTITETEVDSAIPFSCITTPEVVSSCNTTSSNTQAAVAVDPKPLQLEWSYRAVCSVVGAPPAAPHPHPPRAPPDQPRSVIANTFNGLPLSRPNYGSTGSTSQDEYKKSLDENGNSVQGFSSPLSGSSQHKKPRRKKSSKNETVIKSHQIDGYQGNKDLNEVLRFIESNAERTRANKLGRAKHKDDADDKGGKKRSTERRKDKESKMKRATSMEELSRTKLEDLTDKPAKKERRADGAPAKAERRSWGDDARDYFRDEPDAPADDFQTVTKKRKPRRRTDEPGAGDPPRARPPSPRARRVSAPPSDRSNDSNDDLDSVHSLPAEPAPRLAPASYADIARTRHNIPDLIESCNFYAEPELRPPPRAPHDDYPALEPRRAHRPAPAHNKPPPTPASRGRKPERGECEAMRVAGAAESPAPDVVSDRRPPVILLDSAARHHDMDGVTFGFDINEQLLGGPGRRPRCDLVLDALAGGAAGGAVCVRAAGGRLLRYVAPPAAPPPPLLVDYVGAAWEDVLRCGGGKVRYYSE